MITKILLIEDNKEISDNIKQFLELEDFSVEVARDGELGIDKGLSKEYDLILLDLMLPKIDGLTIANKLSKKIDTPIIMVTAKGSIEDKIIGFDNGAIDYIIKPFDLRELEARIKAHLRIGVKTNIIKTADLYIDLKKREFIKSGKTEKISTKEFLIFDFLYANKDRLITRTDIIDYVWGESAIFESDGKLDVYISTLRKKLGKEIIETVKGVGYKYGLK